MAKINKVANISVFVILPLILAVYVYYIISQNIADEPAQFSGQVGKDAKGSYKPDVKKAVKDWREQLEKKGSGYKRFLDADIKYTEGSTMYLVIAGHVFDVSDAGKMYGEDGGYHGFIGKDGTRAFVTGKFDEEGLIPDLSDLTPEDIKGISGWINFYMNHEKYKFKGILVGWFFDRNGKPTENLKDVIRKTAIAEEEEKAQAKVEERFPTCNVEWTAETGSRLWCSSGSGGTERSWVGLPRVFKEEGKDERCACVNTDDLQDPRVKEYKGCAKDSLECKIKA